MPWPLIFCTYMGHDHSSQGIKSRSKLGLEIEIGLGLCLGR